MKKIVPAMLVLLAACETPKPYEGKPLAVGQPGMNNYISTAAGETTVFPRMYEIAPPQIPHTVADYKIDRETNECLDCHMPGLKMSDGHTATRIPKSHYENAHTSDKKEDGPIGIRHNCLQCHVPQAIEEPPYFGR